MIKPNSSFLYWRADEVAECWPCSQPLYEALWNKVVPHMKSLKDHFDIEECCPQDVIGFENLAKHWHRLSEEDHRELNAIAEKMDEEYRAWARSQDTY